MVVRGSMEVVMLRYVLSALMLPSLVLLTSCAITPEQMARQDADTARTEVKLAKALAGYTAGKPVSCISPRNQNTTIFGNAILYSGGSSRKYLTTTNGGCFGLKRDDIIVTRSTNGQLCSGDIVTTVDRTSQFQSGSCSFGDFIPYSRNRRG
jgi:hypothetical protein